MAFPLTPAEVAACYLEFHPALAGAATQLDAEARRALAAELADLWAGAAEERDGVTRATLAYHELAFTLA